MGNVRQHDAKKMCQAAQSASERESVRERDGERERAQEPKHVCVCERERERRGTRDGHLMLWEKLHKMSDALFFCSAAFNIFVVLLLPGDS